MISTHTRFCVRASQIGASPRTAWFRTATLSVPSLAVSMRMTLLARDGFKNANYLTQVVCFFNAVDQLPQSIHPRRCETACTVFRELGRQFVVAQRTSGTSAIDHGLLD